MDEEGRLLLFSSLLLSSIIPTNHFRTRYAHPVARRAEPEAQRAVPPDPPGRACPGCDPLSDRLLHVWVALDCHSIAVGYLIARRHGVPRAPADAYQDGHPRAGRVERRRRQGQRPRDRARLSYVRLVRRRRSATTVGAVFALFEHGPVCNALVVAVRAQGCILSSSIWHAVSAAGQPTCSRLWRGPTLKGDHGRRGSRAGAKPVAV